MKKYFMILTIFVLPLIAACNNNQIVEKECSNDNECFVGGCSNQVCSNKPDIITTCEFKEIYNCYKLTECKCIDNKCQWESNQEFEECLKNEQ